MDNNNVVGCGCPACIESSQNPTSENLEAPTTNGPDALLSGSVWSNDGNGITLTYNFWTSMPSYYAGGDTETSGFKAFSTQQQQAAEKALDLIESFTNITFVETTNEGATDLGFAQSYLDSGVGAWAYYPSLNPKGGDVWTNRTYVDETGLNEGGYDFYTILHEIGHALGLQHTFTGGLTGAQNTEQYSVMAYDWSTWGGTYASSYQLYDIWALQELYGANTSYNTGDDTYILQAGKAYTIWDAGGTDTLDGSAITSNMVLNLDAGTFSSVGLTDNITIAYDVVIENATGGSGNDTFYGNDANNILIGGAGNDTFYGDAGDDTLNGETGDDTVIYNVDISNFLVQIIDSITAVITDTVGNWGSDTLIDIENFNFNGTVYDWTTFQTFGVNPDPVLTKFFFDSQSYSYTSNSFTTDTVTGTQMGYNGTSGNVATFTRGAGGLFITIANNQAPDTLEIYGNNSNELITVNGVHNNLSVTYYGYDDDDNITIEVTGNDILRGHAGNDVLSSGAGADTLWGDEGDDTLSGGTGNDRLLGGIGADILHGGAGADLLWGENGNDTLNGDAGNDTLKGDAGNDTLSGGDNNDRLYGGVGNDTLNGDAGTDFLWGEDGDDTINGGDGIDYLRGGSGLDTLNGGNGDDNLRSGIGNDILNGDAGNDRAYGEDGNDTINGGAGDDVLYGNAGDDTINGGDDNDIIYGGADNDTINGDAGNDTLYGNGGADTINGGDGDDFINGNDQDDTINGDAGIDTLYGGNGVDTIYGGTGNDTLRGDNGNDNLYGGDDNDLLRGGNGHDYLYGDAGDDTIRGENQNDRLFGGIGNDSLYGDSGNDVLRGEDGNDFLRGGAGADYLYGGTGNDRFYFGTAELGTGVDTLFDFNEGEGDRIDLRDLLSSYDSLTDDINDFITLTENGGNTTISVDTNGATGGALFQDVLTIDGTTGLDTATLITNNNLLVE